MINHQSAIVLTRDEHIRQIESFWRQKDIARLKDEVIFEDEEFTVLKVMPEIDFPSEKRNAWERGALFTAVFLWAPIVIIGWEIFRP